MSSMIYLDYAAATPVNRKVLVAMQPYFSDVFYNPSAAYGLARQTRADYSDAKHRIAQVIGAKPAEIVMTSGATESIALAINGVGGGVLTTSIEHPAVLKNAPNAKIIPVDEHGLVDVENVRKYITDDINLISIGYANNEIGTVQNIKEIAAICRETRLERSNRGVDAPLVLHTDASQVAGLLDINVARLGVDLMTLNSDKCYGPKGVGLLYVRAGTKLEPIVRGGGQEMGFRSGTENVAGVVGFAVALEIVEKRRKTEVKRLEELRKNLEKYITYDIKNVKLNGSKKHCLSNILNFSIPGLDGERAVFALDQKGVCMATGSACSANKGNRSHVLTAIGLTDELSDGSLRISMGRGTTLEQIEKLKPILLEVIENELKLS